MGASIPTPSPSPDPSTSFPSLGIAGETTEHSVLQDMRVRAECLVLGGRHPLASSTATMISRGCAVKVVGRLKAGTTVKSMHVGLLGTAVVNTSDILVESFELPPDIQWVWNWETKAYEKPTCTSFEKLLDYTLLEILPLDEKAIERRQLKMIDGPLPEAVVTETPRAERRQLKTIDGSLPEAVVTETPHAGCVEEKKN